MRVILTFLSLLFLISSCTLAPKKELPNLPISTDYVQEKTLPKNEEPAVNLTTWWEQFNDPLLNELVQKSAQKNFDILTASEQINSARAGLTIASSRLLPSLGLFGVPAKVKTSKDLNPFPGSRLHQFFITGFDADWELDFFGKNLSAKEEAYYSFLATKEKAYFIQLIVVAEVVKMYTQIRSLQQRLSITQQKIKVFENLLSLTETLKESGLNSLIAVEKKIADLNQAKSEEPAIKELLEETIANLAFMLGGDLTDYKQRLEKEGRIPQPFGKVPVGLPSDLLHRRPDIKEAEYNLFASGASIGQARASLFPTFALSGILGNSTSTLHHFFWKSSNFWGVLPTVNWNIFSGGRLLAQIELANSQQKVSLIAYEKAVYNALKEVENALIGYSQTSLQTRDLLLECQAQKKITKLSYDLFSSGLINLLNLLDEYTQLFTSQEKYIESKEETMIKLISLYKALGGDLTVPEAPQVALKN